MVHNTIKRKIVDIEHTGWQIDGVETSKGDENRSHSRSRFAWRANVFFPSFAEIISFSSNRLSGETCVYVTSGKSVRIDCTGLRVEHIRETGRAENRCSSLLAGLYSTPGENSISWSHVSSCEVLSIGCINSCRNYGTQKQYCSCYILMFKN